MNSHLGVLTLCQRTVTLVKGDSVYYICSGQTRPSVCTKHEWCTWCIPATLTLSQLPEADTPANTNNCSLLSSRTSLLQEAVDFYIRRDAPPPEWWAAIKKAGIHVS